MKQPVRDSARNFWLPELDGLRGIACALVLIAHFNPHIGDYRSPILEPLKALSPGNVGVILFYALSAFLLTSLCLREFDRTGRINFVTFMLRRIFRIWPLYFFVLILTIFVVSPLMPQAPGVATSSEQWAWVLRYAPLYAAFVGNWFHHQVSEIGILWTICVEEQFYLLLPLIVLSAMRTGRGALFVICGIALSALSIVLLAHASPPFSVPYYHTTTYIPAFAFGSVAAYLYRNGRASFFANPLPIALLSLIAGVLLVQNPNFWWRTSEPSSVALYQFVQMFAASVVFWVALNSGSRYVSFLGFKIAHAVGVLSYGTYLFHALSHRLINLESALLGLQPVALAYHLLFLQYSAFALFCAALAYGLIEKPFLDLRRRHVQGQGADHTRWDISSGQIANWSGLIAILCLIALAFMSDHFTVG